MKNETALGPHVYQKGPPIGVGVGHTGVGGSYSGGVGYTGVGVMQGWGVVSWRGGGLYHGGVGCVMEE